MNRWWGYEHANGSLQVKRYFDRRDVEDARESPFVSAVVMPFDAADRTDALRIMREKLGREWTA